LSKWTRWAGLGGVLDLAVDAGDSICERTNYFPLRATGAGITLRGRLRHHSFLAGLHDDGDDYARPISRTLSKTLPSGWTFVDGGAHIGYHTIEASRLVGDAGRVLAFEPDPYNLAALRRNVRGLENVELRCEALGAVPGLATFRRSRGTISSSLVPREGIQLIDTFDVPVVTIDDVVVGDPRVFVKLDLEGLEIDVLEGMRRTAAEADELVVMAETNQTALGFAGKTPLDLIETLESLGLDVYHARDDDKLVPAREDALWKGDLIGLRPDANRPG
jgi:FkbM family methyltransferase